MKRASQIQSLYHAEYNCMLFVYVDDFKLAGPTENMEKAWASIKRAVNIGDPELKRKAHPFAHFLALRRLLQHGPNIGQLIFGNMTPSTKLGQGIISSHVRSSSSLVMRGGVCQIFAFRTGYNVRQKC